jgi:hypothetical protein
LGFRHLSHHVADRNQTFDIPREGALASMINRHNSLSGLLILVAGALLWLGGCRAFQPEAIIVNKPPETFIVGAPTEHGGGYYRFHVYWYGSDEDGKVDRFVWALTDTTIQDEETVEDEEDQRFNPALDASTLEIGHWTTNTDSIFTFTIDQGINQSADMTLHLVAVDDYGDFDRTPARLHFFSNTLGNPSIEFFKVVDGEMIPLVPGVADTVGFRRSYHVAWQGETPNIRGFGEIDSIIDPVPPYDGLLGYKWLVEGDLGGNCVPSLEDCWSPRRFDEASGDSVSYFGAITSLRFANDGTGTNVFGQVLPSGPVGIQVNSIDVAGVEVADYQRSFDFIVNYDPETRFVVDPPLGPPTETIPPDDDLYPYYILMNDPNLGTDPVKYHFQPGDRIPDRSYVVFKALARDDPRDAKDPTQNPDFKVGLAGFYQGVRENFFGGTFSFASETSVLDTLPEWSTADGWYGDTLGFLVPPRSEVTVKMQAVDEHGRRDGTPPELSFSVGYPPCVQCVEILPKTSMPSAYPRDHACVESVETVSDNTCFQDVTELTITSAGLGANDLEKGPPAAMLINKGTGFVRVVDPTEVTPDDLANNYKEDADIYYMTILLHGQDDDRETWTEPAARSKPLSRIGGWRYQVSNTCDIYNEIRDGGGNDDINEPTWGEPGDGRNLDILTTSGLWKLTVEVAVPRGLVTYGPDSYKIVLGVFHGAEAADLIFEAVTKQFGDGWVDVVALDQTSECLNPIRPARFNLFRSVRPPVRELTAGTTWRDCVLPSALASQVKTALGLGQSAMPSLDGEAVRKYFRLTVVTTAGEFVCE